MVPSESNDITTTRLAMRIGAASIVVIANLAILIYVVSEAQASWPRDSAPAMVRAADGVAPASTTEPTPPTSEPPRSAVSIPPTTSTPVVVQPPSTTWPMATATTTPSPFAPAARVVPAVRTPTLPSNIPPSPNFLAACGSTTYNDSDLCVWEVIAAIDNARAFEALPPMVLPTNWNSLTVPQQLFVATNLERTVRGLTPLSGMAPVLDAAAAQGAAANTDPQVPLGFPTVHYGANWAGVLGNPLEAMYYWMYDDGLGSSNIDCSLSAPAGCWGHRQNVLFPLSCAPCVMGAAWGTTDQATTSVTELIVDARGSPAIDFTWSQEEPYFP